MKKRARDVPRQRLTAGLAEKSTALSNGFDDLPNPRNLTDPHSDCGRGMRHERGSARETPGLPASTADAIPDADIADHHRNYRLLQSNEHQRGNGAV